MNDPLIDRPVAYWLDWLEDFRQRIEDEREDKKRVVNDIAAPLRGHPLPEWLVKRATWEGIGVLQFKARNPDWLAMYRASYDRFHDDDDPRPYLH